METMFLPRRCCTSTLPESKLCFLLLKTLAQPRSYRFVIKRVCLDDTKLKESDLQGSLREVCQLCVYLVFQIFPWSCARSVCGLCSLQTVIQSLIRLGKLNLLSLDRYLVKIHCLAKLGFVSKTLAFFESLSQTGKVEYCLALDLLSVYYLAIQYPKSALKEIYYEMLLD